MPTPSLHREVERRLTERDIRYTKGRRSVVTTLATADGPRSAAELHGDIGSAVPLSSLYRCLTVLEDAGVVAPHFASKGITRYELAEWLTGHHHHLVCLDCGSVEDIDVLPSQESRVRSVVGEIAAAAAFTAVDHSLEIEGRCSQCG